MVSKGLPPPRPFPFCVPAWVVVDVVAVDCAEVVDVVDAVAGVDGNKPVVDAGVTDWKVSVGIEVEDITVVEVVGAIIVKLVLEKAIDCVGVEFKVDGVDEGKITVNVPGLCDVVSLDVVVAGVRLVD